MKKPELLAPAGSFEKAKVAFLYGADAVYAGTTKLSLRTRTSMQFDDLVNTVKLAHSLNKKVYVAMNIYARDNEYDLVKEEAKYLDELGVDGIIISDGGIVDVVKEYAQPIFIEKITIATKYEERFKALSNYEFN